MIIMIITLIILVIVNNIKVNNNFNTENMYSNDIDSI